MKNFSQIPKDFSKWGRKKAEIQNKEAGVFFHEREVWFAHLGANVGFEQDGKGENFGRPIIIFRKFNNEVFWGVPLTTQPKRGKFYLPVSVGDGLERVAIVSQMRLFDAKRLYQKLAMIDKTTYERLLAAVLRLVRGR